MIHYVLVALWALLACVWILDALRLRRRASQIRPLPPSDEPVSDDHSFVCAPGVELDEATRRAASACARREKLEVLDLVPRGLSTWRAMLLLGSFDPEKLKTDLFAIGRTAGYALLVSKRVRQGAEHAQAPQGPRAMFEWARRFKHHAPGSMGVAVAPGLSARAGRDDLTMRRAAARELFGDFTAVTLGVQALLLLAALAGPFVAGTAGIIALALYHLQPLVVFGGTSMLPRDLFVNALVRAPLDLARIAQMGWAESSPAPVEGSVQAEVAQKRARYQELVSQGTAGFFEPRREDCPVCGSRTLEVKLSTIDVFQQKPGRFTIERCQGCGHLFQNPRLSLAGLDFYYGDFYDGLGEAGLEAVFAHGPDEYLSRARSVEGLVTPKSWLDVGTGHGHFGLVARSVWPGARMDGLDLSESIEEAERRGWVDKGIRGLFPEIAPRLAAEGQRWDVVSMSHYLEHTRDQRAEIAAAGKVLADGGVLLIEVPDPDSKIQHLLGRFWTPWFQPQHQHFVSVKNVERLLREEGFEPVRWLRGEAHRPVDFALSVVLFLKYLLPWVDTPWRARPQGRLVRLATTLAWTLCVPLVLIGAVLDGIFNPVFKRAGWSNAYRVVARRAVLPSAAKGATDGQKQAPLSMEDGSSTRGSP